MIQLNSPTEEDETRVIEANSLVSLPLLFSFLIHLTFGI